MSLYPTLSCETSECCQHRAFIVIDPMGQYEAFKVYATDEAEAQQVYRSHVGMQEGGRLCVEEICEEECEAVIPDIAEGETTTTDADGGGEPIDEADTDVLIEEPTDADGGGEPDNPA